MNKAIWIHDGNDINSHGHSNNNQLKQSAALQPTIYVCFMFFFLQNHLLFFGLNWKTFLFSEFLYILWLLFLFWMYYLCVPVTVLMQCCGVWETIFQMSPQNPQCCFLLFVMYINGSNTVDFEVTPGICLFNCSK